MGLPNPRIVEEWGIREVRGVRGAVAIHGGGRGREIRGWGRSTGDFVGLGM